LVWQRDGETQRAKVTLGAFQSQDPPPSRYDRWGGGPFSERRFDIPAVLPHDIPVAPEDCGGPLFDRHGRLVGINIARALRVATYAVPIERVWQAIADLQAI
jgi:serine protease Do